MRDTDVVIVGFRCAGAPLARALHRAGVKAIVIDKDPLFSDQAISTHAIQPYGMRILDRLGLGDVVRDLAPPNRAFRFQMEDSYLQMDLDGDQCDSRSPRRSVLDPALQRAAIASGVEARGSTRVTALLRDGERVAGVRVVDHGANGREYEIRAPLVIGADGRHSTIAKLTGAPSYLESTSPQGIYWSYFEKTPLFDTDPRYDWGACIHIERNEARAVFQTDSNLLLLGAGGPRDVVRGWRSDPTAALHEQLRRGALTAPLLEGSRMVAPPVGQISMSFFMKRPVGPGWALVGDSGLHINPTPGLGITDAVRDAAALADAIVDGSERAMQLYWRRRDAESIGLYHFADEMGSEDYNNPLNRAVYRRAQSEPSMAGRMRGMMTREVRPHDMIPTTMLVRWLMAETMRGHFAPWRWFGRGSRQVGLVKRRQRTLDRALARAEGGYLDDALPRL